MKALNISGHHIAVGEELQEYVKSRLSEISKRGFRALGASVIFSKLKHQFICNIVTNSTTRNHNRTQGAAVAGEIFSAFDLALNKIARQLDKYRSRVQKR